MALPSPTSATTGRSGSAILAPIAAGSPQPMPPPRRPKKLCSSSLLIIERTPGAEERISSITTASFGSMAPIASSSASGCTGVLPAMARALARNASRSVLIASVADFSRAAAALLALAVMRARDAAVISGKVAFGSPRIATLAG